MCRKAWGFKSPLPHQARQFNRAELYFTEFMLMTATRSGLSVLVIAICLVSDTQLVEIRWIYSVAIDARVMLS